MEESLNLVEQIHLEFGLKQADIRTYSPLTLAFIGDSIYEIVIRTIVTEQGNRSVNKIHQTKSNLVKAQTQSKMADCLKGEFTEDELTIYKRGKNAKVSSSAKNASLNDYHRATGFEAVMGYLYLTKQTGRILHLIKCGIEQLQMPLL